MSKPTRSTNGNECRSIAKASMVSGIHYPAAKYRIMAYGELVDNSQMKRPWRKCANANGQTFDTMKELAECYGVTSVNVSYHMKKYGHFKGFTVV